MAAAAVFGHCVRVGDLPAVYADVVRATAAIAGMQKALLCHDVKKVAGDGRGRVDDTDLTVRDNVGSHFADRIGEKRIMGASEHDGIGARIEQRLQACPDYGFGVEPCRFPEKAIGSLEAYGVNVSLLAQTAGMRYINGQNTVTYFGAILCRAAVTAATN